MRSNFTTSHTHIHRRVYIQACTCVYPCACDYVCGVTPSDSVTSLSEIRNHEHARKFQTNSSSCYSTYEHSHRHSKWGKEFIFIDCFDDFSWLLKMLHFGVWFIEFGAKWLVYMNVIGCEFRHYLAYCGIQRVFQVPIIIIIHFRFPSTANANQCNKMTSSLCVCKNEIKFFDGILLFKVNN